MSKYLLHIDRVPDEGANETLIEREISAEEVVTMLAAMVKEPIAAEPEEEEEPEPVRRKYTKKAKPAKVTKGAKKKVGRKEPCPECGSKGSRHFNTCSLKGASPKMIEEATTTAVSSEPITEAQFDHVKEKQEEGDASSLDLSKEFDCPVREVNIAIFSKSYDEYLEKRTKPTV